MFKKVAIALSLSLILTLVVGGGYLYGRLKSAVPSYEGELELAVLESPVVVTLDEWGIPHLKASSELDARRALGYLMARERLFQMDLYRLVAKGELARVVGAKALPLDRLYRVLGLRRTSERWLANGVIDAEVLAHLNAFFEGVNAFVEEENFPFEYLLLGSSPEKFSAVDALSFVGYMAYSFNVAAKQDLLLPQLAAKYGAHKVEMLRGETSSDRPTMTASTSYNKAIIENLSEIERWHDLIGRIEGSNAWVLSGARSESGFPILASDPHISFTLPNLWFEASLSFPRAGQEVVEYGHFLPLIGVPVMAHNHDFGWGLTMSFIDDMDFYQETINAERTKVRYQNEWHDLKFVQEKIEIKGGESETLSIALTPHGPLVDSAFETKDVSMWWAFNDDDNRALEAFFKMGRARNHEEFAAAVALGGAPGMNVLYADRHGHIGWWMLGKVPLRAKHVKSDFLLAGDSGKNDVMGKLPFLLKPFQLDPASGVIVSANQRPVGSDLSLRGDYQSMDRYHTIEGLLATKEKWSLEELKGIQTLNFNLEDEWRRSLLLGDVEGAQVPLQKTHLLEELRQWDGVSSATSRPALLFHHWLFKVERLLFDELNEEEFHSFCRLNSEVKALTRLLKREDDEWWDLARTSERRETRPEVVALAWNEAIAELSREFGNDEAKWNWGAKHVLPFVHPLGAGSVLESLLTFGPYPASGGYNNVNNLRRIGCAEGHVIRAGPSTRRLIDFAKPEESFGVLPLGNSGHLLSDYFKNQLPLFLEGEYRKQTFGPSGKVLHLRPK